MSQTDDAAMTTATTPSISTRQKAVITNVVSQLDNDEDMIEVYEGEATGRLYIETEGVFHEIVIGETGISVTDVESPGESYESLARIEPDDGGVVGSVNTSLTFSGD